MRKYSWEELTEILPKQIEQILTTLKNGDASKFLDFLSVQGCLHTYSAHNVVLMMHQKPDLTMVAGYKKWLEQCGRQVKQGARALWIRMPVFKTVPDINEQTGQIKKDRLTGKNLTKEVLSSYKWGKVFDISDTEGPEIPQFRGNNASEVLDRIKQCGYTLHFAPISDNLEASGSRITVNLNLKSSSNLVLLLVLKHITQQHLEQQNMKRNRVVPYNVTDMESLAVAEALCRSQGIENTEYVSGALSAWTFNDEQSNRSFEEIGRTVKKIVALLPDVFIAPENHKDPIAV